MALLQVEGLVSGYGEIEVISDVTLEVNSGEVVALVGPNGAGKSTFLKTLGGILPVMSGRVMFDGADITAASSRERVQRGLALVPEGRELFWDMTVIENLQVSNFAAGKNREFEELAKLVFSLFPRLLERREQIAGTMSGGEQQMLAIGRALMVRPKLLMLDEPSAGLAPSIVQLVVERIHEIRRQGTTVLLVEQDVPMALQLCDRAYVLERGHVIGKGTGREIEASGTLIKAYLGNADEAGTAASH